MTRYCAGCRYDEVLDQLEEAARQANQELVLVADPGCLVTLADRLDAKYAIGSAVAVADGMSKMRMRQRPVAILGDSSFFHSTIPAICNAVYNQSDILIVVLDNAGAVTSGDQPHPGVGRAADGSPAPKLNMEEIARACGVGQVCSVDLDAPGDDLTRSFKALLESSLLSLIIVSIRREHAESGMLTTESASTSSNSRSDVG